MKLFSKGKDGRMNCWWTLHFHKYGTRTKWDQRPKWLFPYHAWVATCERCGHLDAQLRLPERFIQIWRD